MSLVGRLAGDAQRLRDLLPGPSFVNRTFHRLALHSIGEATKADDRRDRCGGFFGNVDHAPTVARSALFVNLC